MIALTRDQWQNIERGRTPLRYGVAFKLRSAIGISLDWLSGMPREITSPDLKRWPQPGIKGALDSALFSDVALELNANVDRGLGFYRDSDLPQNFPSWITDRADWAEFFSTYIAQRFAMVAPNKIGAFGHDILEAINQVAEKFEKHPSMAEIFFKQMQEYTQWKQSRKESDPRRAGGPPTNQLLTNSATSGNVESMQGKWPALKKQLQAATEKTGKSALAKFLKVDLTRVSQWLTDAKSQREPGAEYALQMQDWLERQT